MSGPGRKNAEAGAAPRWYELVDITSDRVVGEISERGEVASDDPGVVARVQAALSRELMMRDGEVAEDLGVCFADVTFLRPGDLDYLPTVLRNLALLTGYLPRER